jgi:heme/copper-type cytochrome/quinol oxidase subunit 3
MMSTSTYTREERDEQRRKRAEREAALRLKNNKLGITIFQWTWILVFVCLVLVYWQMGFTPGWHPTPDQKPGLLLPVIATVLLLVSAWTARVGLRQVKADSVPGFQSQWLIAIVTGGLFFLIMVQQFFALPGTGIETEQYGQLYRVMIGYHVAHALAILFMMIQVYRYSQLGNYHANNHWSVEATVRLWDFVVVAWLMFFVVLYLI